MNRNLITLVGRAEEVFKFFNTICQEYGYLKLKDLAKHCYKNNCFILWEAGATK